MPRLIAVRSDVCILKTYSHVVENIQPRGWKHTATWLSIQPPGWKHTATWLYVFIPPRNRKFRLVSGYFLKQKSFSIKTNNIAHKLQFFSMRPPTGSSISHMTNEKQKMLALLVCHSKHFKFTFLWTECHFVNGLNVVVYLYYEENPIVYTLHQN